MPLSFPSKTPDAAPTFFMVVAFWSAVTLAGLALAATTILPARSKLARLKRMEEQLEATVLQRRTVRDEHAAHLQAFNDPRYITARLRQRGYRIRD